MPRLRMRDFWTFKPKEVMSKSNHLFDCKDSISDSLYVKVAATHSGVVNKNYRFYRPDRMQDAAHQWVPETGKGYPKPVLVEHNKDGDVLGRVRAARYVDESYKWNGDFPTIKDSIFYDKKIDLFKSVDWIVENLMTLPDYSGLGYLELGLNITNPEAIRKVMADEYLTVSVGFTTGSAICNVCHQDWAADDKCDHHPGSTDEESGKKAFLICGDFKYEELSFVNFPADPFAGKVAKDALKDSLNRKFFMGMSHDKQQAVMASAGMSMSDAVMDYDIQIVEDTVATVYDLTKLDQQVLFEGEVKADALTAVRAFELKQNLQDWKPEVDAEKTKKRSITSTLNAKIKKNNWKGIDTSTTTQDDEVNAAIAEGDGKCTCTAGTTCECEVDWSKEQLSAEETEFFSDEEGLYAEMIVEMDAALAAGELTDELVKDAKLSTEKRKSLGASTFCGPNRSFPVPDCAHVTAARRLIGRAKVGDGTKSKILACVSRKASSLGCGGTSKKDAVTNPQVTEKPDTKQGQDTEFQTYVTSLNLDLSDGHATEALTHYTGLDKCYKGAPDNVKGNIRMLHYDLGQKWSAESALAWSKKYLQEQEKDSVIISAKELADKEEAINSLTDEVTKANDALTASKATAGEMLKAVKKSLATQIVIYKSLSGHTDYKDLDQAGKLAKVEELSKRHVTSLKDAVADIMSELKWSESAIVPPTDKVIEPGKSVDDNVQVTDPAPADKVETDEEKTKRLLAEESALLDRLSYMTPRERRIYLADLEFNNSKESAKKKV